MVRRIGLLVVGLWLATDVASAQVTRSQRISASERVVIGTSSFGTTSPLQIAGLPTKSSQTACAWLDATGNVFTGACPTGDLTGLTFTAPGIFSVSGSPCTSGDCAIGLSLTNQSANLVFAGPSAGGTAPPTFRALVDSDVPNDLTLGTVSGNPSFTGHVAVGGNTALAGDLAVNGGDLTTASGNLTVAPAGDLVLTPGGFDVLPGQSYVTNLGSILARYLTGHFAELWAATLVAQDVLSTVGGSVLVTPTTALIADLTAVSGASTIDVKHSLLASGDVVMLQSAGKFEAMAVTSGPTPITGGFRYSVTRNADGSGATTWAKGDAVALTGNGSTGGGFLDLFSTRGLERATCVENASCGTSRYGPTLVGNWRTGAGWNAFGPRFAIGNLDGLYGYSGTRWGAAFGPASGQHLTVDDTNGLRIRHNTLDRLKLDSTGLRLFDSTGASRLVLDNAGNAQFTGTVTITSGSGYSNLTDKPTLGSLAAKSSVDLNSGEVTNKSLAALDGTANTKVNNADTWRANVAYGGTTEINGGQIRTGTVTASKLSVTGSGGLNLVRDGSFELGMSEFNCYTNSGETTHCSVYYDSTNAYGRFGRYSWLVNWTQNTSTKGLYGPLGRGGWTPGRQYTVAFWARHNTLTNPAQMAIYWNTAPTYQYAPANPALSSTWQLYVFHLTWGASVEANGYGFISITTGQSGAGGLFVDALQVFEGAHVSPELLSAFTPAIEDIPAGAVFANMIATNAVTADKIEANALNGKTITGGTLRTGSGGTPDGAVNISNSGIVLGTATGYTSAARVSLNGMGYLYGTSAGSRWNGQGGNIEILAENVGGAVKLGAPQGVQTFKHLFPGYATGTYQNTYGLYRSSTIATALAINGDLELAGIYKTGGAWLANGGTTTLCDNSGWIYRCNASSRRYKTHIVPAPLDRRVLDLQPVRFDYREPNPVTGEPLPRSLGLIAEDVDALGLKDLVTYQDGQPEAVQYDKLALYLLPMMKQQQEELADLKARLAALESVIFSRPVKE